MSQSSSIEWTDATWNPVTGCTKITAGCDHCYAENFSERFRGVPGHPYEVGFDLTLRPSRLEDPLRWKSPRVIFVNSMSDLFHKEVPWDYADKVFDTMEKADWHIYQVLTKRSSLMRDYINNRYAERALPDHIWLGVSIENKQARSRVDHLRQTNAPVRFLSVEPLLEDLGRLDVTGLHWVIVGGESGRGARPMMEEWVVNVRDTCLKAGVAFFFKQWGAWGSDGVRRSKKENGRLLMGRTWDEMPTSSPLVTQRNGKI